MSAAGSFIVFEGGDGAGKSTQLEALAHWLRGTGRQVTLTREPGGTELGQQIRQLLLHGDHVEPRAEALLFAADRAHHVATVVRPVLERGEVVLQDRYFDSSVAYQGEGRDLDGADVLHLSLWATRELHPDLTVLLDVDPSVGRSRRGDTHDRLEREADDFHHRVRRRFLELAEQAPERYLVLDASRPREELTEAIRERVAAALGDPE